MSSVLYTVVLALVLNSKCDPKARDITGTTGIIYINDTFRAYCSISMWVIDR